MPWFKIDDGFTNSKPVLRLQRRVRVSAIGLWTLAGAWSAKEMTDGFIPDYVIEELASTPAIAGHLVKCGLWEEAVEGWQFKGWEKYQPTREQIMEARDREAERKRKYRESQRRPSGTSAGQTEGHHRESEPPDPTRPDPTRPSSEEAKASSVSEPERPDVEHVISSFSELLKANDVKHNKPGKAWKDAARLLIDKDGYTPEQILYVARYATADEFWKSNILSLPKLREKFEALKIKAQAANRPPQHMDHSARARAKEADMLARLQQAEDQQAFLEIED